MTPGGKGLSNRLCSGVGWNSSTLPRPGRGQEGGQSTRSEKRGGSRDLKAKPQRRRESTRDPQAEGSEDWNPKGNLWEKYAHDSCRGNAEATNASARQAPGSFGREEGKVMSKE